MWGQVRAAALSTYPFYVLCVCIMILAATFPFPPLPSPSHHCVIHERWVTHCLIPHELPAPELPPSPNTVVEIYLPAESENQSGG